jgi:death-on-curing protein
MNGGQSWNWIDEDVALAAHDALVAEFGGLAGVRDLSLLQSALARPCNLVAYGSPDAASLAAAYTFGLLRNRPFVDGNKRTGYALAIVFLLDNGLAFAGSDIESVDTMLGVAAGTINEDDLAAWFRARVQPLRQLHRVGKTPTRAARRPA